MLCAAVAVRCCDPATSQEEDDALTLTLLLRILTNGSSDADFPPLGPPSQTPSRQQSISLTNNATRRSTPDVPPGFEHHTASVSQSGRATPTVPPGLEGLGTSSGRATPTAPPGLPAPSGLSKPPTAVPANVTEDAATISSSISRPGSRAALKRQITPVLPLRPATPKREVSMAGKEKEKEVEHETPTKKPAEARKPSVDVGEAKGKGKEKQVVQDAQPHGDASKPEVPAEVKEDLPKAPTSPKAERKVAQQSPAKGAAPTQSTDAKAAPVTPSKPEPKGRKHPGKLDITAAMEKTPDNAAAQAKAGAADAAGTSSTVQTPLKTESPSLASPAVKNAPRTLRVVQTPTPKAETPPTTAHLPAEKPKDAVPAAVRAPSRQPSIASIQNLPGTPSSEQVSMSDNISLTSASQSRANSPPPSVRTVDATAAGASKIVGSAPVRQKTKAQAKKERQERAKQIEEEKAKADAEAGAASKVEEEPQQEAIVSRKKKAKKDKPAPAPKPATKGKERGDVPPAAAATKTPTTSHPPSPSTKPSKPPTPTKAPSIPRPTEPSPPPSPASLTPAQLIADLKTTHPTIQKSIESLLRHSPTSTTAFKPPHPITPADLAQQTWKTDLRFQLTKEDVDALLRGDAECRRFGGDGGRVWDRGMVTSEGRMLRALGRELEERFLELERAVRGVSGEATWRATKPQNEMRFEGVDLEGLRRELDGLAGAGGGGGASGRGGTAMEQMVLDGGGARRGAFLLDEVSRYVNEFVMPPAAPGQGQGASVPVAGQQHAPVHGGSGRSEGAAVAGVGGGGVSVEIAERQLAEARRVSEEREGALRKVARKNRKILGLA